jgi:hypothetical protein
MESSNSNILNDNSIGRTVMCQQALFDAVHDYGHGIVRDRQKIADIVREVTPCNSETVYSSESPTHTPGSIANVNVSDATINEDAFLAQYILKAGKADTFTIPNNPMAAKDKIDQINAGTEEGIIWSDFIADNYLVKAIFRPGMSHPCPGVTAKDKGTWYRTQLLSEQFETAIRECGEIIGNPTFWRQSYIQQILEDWGVQTDVFCICDTDKGNVREDLAMADPDKGQTFYWLQTPQTLFDPAGKLQWSYSSPASRSTGFFEPRSPIQYAWQTATPGIRRNIFYPEWPIAANNTWSTELERNNPGSSEQQMCANVGSVILHTLGSSNNPYAPRTQDGVLQIEERSSTGEKTGKFIYVTSKLASRNFQTTTPSSSIISSYVKEGKQFISDLIASISRTGDKTPADIFSMYANRHLFMAKRFGDGAQAAICTHESIPYSKPAPEAFTLPIKSITSSEQIIDKDDEGKPLMTNGNHMFVTIDRIAAATALIFLAPMVLYSGSNGMYIFVRKNVPSPQARLESLFSHNFKTLSVSIKYNPEDIASRLSSIENLNVEQTIIDIKQCINSINPHTPLMQDERYASMTSWASKKAPVLSTRGVSINAAITESLRSYIGFTLSLGPSLIKAASLYNEKSGLFEENNGYIININQRFREARVIILLALQEYLNSIPPPEINEQISSLKGDIESNWPETDELIYTAPIRLSTIPTQVGTILYGLTEILITQQASEPILKKLGDGISKLSAIIRDVENKSLSIGADVSSINVDFSDDGLGIQTFVSNIGNATAQDKINYLYNIIPKNCLSNIDAFQPHNLFGLRLGSRLRKIVTSFGASNVVGEELVAQLQQQLNTAITRSNDALAITTLIQPSWDFLTINVDSLSIDLLTDFRKNIIETIYNFYLTAGGDTNVSFNGNLSAATLFMTALDTLGNVLVPIKNERIGDMSSNYSGFVKTMAFLNLNNNIGASLDQTNMLTLILEDPNVLTEYDNMYRSKTEVNQLQTGGAQEGEGIGNISKIVNTLKYLRQPSLSISIPEYIRTNIESLAAHRASPTLGSQISLMSKDSIASTVMFDSLARKLYVPLVLHLARYKSTDGIDADLELKFGEYSANYSSIIQALSIYLLKENSLTINWDTSFDIESSRLQQGYVTLKLDESFIIPAGHFKVIQLLDNSEQYQFSVELPHMRDANNIPLREDVFRRREEVEILTDGSLKTYLGAYSVVVPMPIEVRNVSPAAAYFITYIQPTGAIALDDSQVGSNFKEAIMQSLSGTMPTQLNTMYDDIMAEIQLQMGEETETDRTGLFFNALQSQIDNGRTTLNACKSHDPVSLIVAYQDWYNKCVIQGVEEDLKLDEYIAEMEQFFDMNSVELVHKSIKRRMNTNDYNLEGGKLGKRTRDDDPELQGRIAKSIKVMPPDEPSHMIDASEELLPLSSRRRQPPQVAPMESDSNGLVTDDTLPALTPLLDEDIRPSMVTIGEMAGFFYEFLLHLGDYTNNRFVVNPTKIAELRNKIFIDLLFNVEDAIEGTVLSAPLPSVMFLESSMPQSVEENSNNNIIKTTESMAEDAVQKFKNIFTPPADSSHVISPEAITRALNGSHAFIKDQRAYKNDMPPQPTYQPPMAVFGGNRKKTRTNKVTRRTHKTKKHRRNK